MMAASVPWQPFLAPHLPTLRSDIEREWPALRVWFELGAEHVFVDVAVDGLATADAAQVVAAHLAPLWPALLAGFGVALEVTVGGERGPAWAWEPDALVALGRSDAPRTAWLAAATFVHGA